MADRSGNKEERKEEKKYEEKRYTTGLYLKAFAISVAIFSCGLLIGIYIENFFTSDLSARTAVIENSVREIELEMLYFQDLSDTYSCDFLSAVIVKTNSNLDTLAQELQYSEKNILFTKETIRNIKMTYTSLLIKDWLLQEKVKKSCGADAVTVLYFYTTESCDDCVTQGDVLTLLKDTFKEKLMVFPIDTQIDISMTKILMDRFNVTAMPSIVINGETYTGVIGKDELTGTICEQLPGIDECK